MHFWAENENTHVIEFGLSHVICPLFFEFLTCYGWTKHFGLAERVIHFHSGRRGFDFKGDIVPIDFPIQKTKESPPS